MKDNKKIKVLDVFNFFLVDFGFENSFSMSKLEILNVTITNGNNYFHFPLFWQ
jgi:hypothetical protein